MKRCSRLTDGDTRPSRSAERVALVSRAQSTTFQPGPSTFRWLAIMLLGA